MAWKHRDTGDGPYPMHVGEFCGNHLPGSKVVRSRDETQEDANRRQAVKLSRMRFGKPQTCKAFTTEEGEARGWVGLYLLASREPAKWEIPVPTPPELMEPGQEHLHNIDGQPGIAQSQVQL